MGDGSLQGPLIADTVAVNIGLALMIGSLAGGAWVRRAVSPWAVIVRLRSRSWFRVGTALTATATGLGLWLQSSVMADVPFVDAWPATVTMATGTHAGHAWAAGMFGLLVAGTAGWSRTVGQRHWLWTCVAAVGIAFFAYTRSIVSHAGSQGDVSAALWIDWGHLLLVGAWFGIVFLAGCAVLQVQTKDRGDGQDAAVWVSALSATATWVLVGILLTGVVNVWRGAGPLGRLPGSAYGTALFIKLALVLLAALLGAWNRFRVMPLFVADLAAGVGTRSRHKGAFVRILHFEAVFLSAALVAAAFLSASEPPDTSFQSKPSQEKT